MAYEGQLLIHSLKELNVEKGNKFNIIQPKDNQTLDAFAVELLVNLTYSCTKNLNIVNLQKLLKLYASSANHLAHIELLHKAGILAAMPDERSNVEANHYELGLRNIATDLLLVEDILLSTNDHNIQIHFLGELSSSI